MEIGRKGVKELPTRKMYFKLLAMFVQIFQVLKVFMVPPDQISQNEGSEKP